MSFVLVENGSISRFPYTIGQLKREHPNVSFPEILNDAVLASYNVYPVVIDNEPTTGTTMNMPARLKDMPELVDGVWKLQWETYEITEEVRELDAIADANAMRGVRDGKLADCDWTQLADADLTEEKLAEWQAYRTALRNMPDHDNWPSNLTEDDWPTKPEV